MRKEAWQGESFDWQVPSKAGSKAVVHVGGHLNVLQLKVATWVPAPQPLTLRPGNLDPKLNPATCIPQTLAFELNNNTTDYPKSTLCALLFHFLVSPDHMFIPRRPVFTVDHARPRSILIAASTAAG